jgi:hypothetical protein
MKPHECEEVKFKPRSWSSVMSCALFILTLTEFIGQLVIVKVGFDFNYLSAEKLVMQANAPGGHYAN